MRKFILSADAGCDLPSELTKKYDVKILPINFLVDGEEYSSDDGRMTMPLLFEKMRAGAKTATFQPNPTSAEEYFENLLSRGYDVLHLSMSHQMSGTYETLEKLSQTINEKSRNKLYVVDTLSQGAGFGLIAIMTAQKSDEADWDAASAKEYAENLRLNVSHEFTVDSLTFLANGGRISRHLAAIGNLLKIKPVLGVDDDGKIIVRKKIIGRKRALDDMAARVTGNYSGLSDTIFVSESDCKEDAEYLKAKINDKLPSAKVEILPLGPIMVCHCGPGVVAVFYTATSRK